MIFTGDITINYQEDSFNIKASYWDDLTVRYASVESIEYRDSDNKGIRILGLGNARILAGAFSNAEFGDYTRYSYTKCEYCIVLHIEGKILVISGPDIQSTKDIYEKIKINIDQK